MVDSEDPVRGWGVFGPAEIGDSQTNPVAWFLSLGLGGNCPLACRPDDTFGIGWYVADSSSRIGTILTSQFGPLGSGQGVELFYNHQLAPPIRLTPDMPFIVPARELVDPALVVGLRAQLIF